MTIDIKVPAVGESVQEAILAHWYKRDGDPVHKGELLFLIETDKVTLEINAEADGVLKILVPEGATVAIGTVVGTLEAQPAPARMEETAPPRPPFPAEKQTETEMEGRKGEIQQPQISLAPSIQRLAEEKAIDTSKITGSGPGGRITRGDLLLHLEEVSAGEVLETPGSPPIRTSPPREIATPKFISQPDSVAFPSGGEVAVVPPASHPPSEERTTRKPMSPIRQRIAQHLLESKKNTATLTTFNEIDMSRVQTIRSQFKEVFRERHGISLGIMSFFIKASVAALREYPEVNAFIDGRDIVHHHYYHIGVAIGAERGLVVPVIRNVDQLSFADLEISIANYVKKIRENRLELSDLEGGTFTVSNGGIYGSLLSTPILNAPQSGILGLHKIEDRPVALGGQVVIRPMMYVALSYDHRIIDGREAVSFLKRIKECVENPERIMMEI